MIAILVLALAGVLRLGLGPRWFAFYGWATIAVTAAPILTWLLWKRLPQTGTSRWWSLLAGLPILIAALVQIVFWSLFFAQGPTNPMYGVMRELVRPWLEAGWPIACVSMLAIWLWLLATAARPVSQA